MDIQEYLRELQAKSSKSKRFPWEQPPASWPILPAPKPSKPLIQVNPFQINTDVNALLEVASRPTSSKPVVATAHTTSADDSRSRAVPRVLVQRHTTPYWQERGWTRKAREYGGYYRTKYGSWQGRAEEGFAGHSRMYIHNPPSFLHNHSRWPCFCLRLGGWYFVHTHNHFDVSEGILQVEQILTEAYGMK